MSNVSEAFTKTITVRISNFVKQCILHCMIERRV